MVVSISGQLSDVLWCWVLSQWYHRTSGLYLQHVITKEQLLELLVTAVFSK